MPQCTSSAILYRGVSAYLGVHSRSGASADMWFAGGGGGLYVNLRFPTCLYVVVIRSFAVNPARLCVLVLCRSVSF